MMRASSQVTVMRRIVPAAYQATACILPVERVTPFILIDVLASKKLVAAINMNGYFVIPSSRPRTVLIHFKIADDRTVVKRL